MKFNFNRQGIGWRVELLPHLQTRQFTYQFKDNHNLFLNGGLYQFGVWNGFSLQGLARIIKHINQVSPFEFNLKYYAFDVFTGMPKEENEPENQIDEVGCFDLLDEYGVEDLDEALELLEDDVRYNLSRHSPLTFFPGLVEDTLTDELAQQLVPASYVDMDMDIYTPTHIALDWMFKHNLIVEGTIIGYDDWVQVQTLKTFEGGEARAHKEIFDKYNVSTIQLLETVNRGQTAFLITSIGGINE